MVAPTPGVRAAAQDRTRHTVLTWLMIAFALPVPLGSVLALLPQLRAVGEVSHWPWEQYGFFGWWLVPLSLAVAASLGAARRNHGRTRPVWVISAMAVLTTVALFFNP